MRQSQPARSRRYEGNYELPTTEYRLISSSFLTSNP